VRPRLDTRPTEQLDHPLIERRPRGNPPSAHRAGPVGRLVVCVKFCKSDNDGNWEPARPLSEVAGSSRASCE
jgi:hypothetical protein